MEGAPSGGRRWRRRRWIVGGVVAAVVVVALALFQPWQLVVDRHVDEALPTSSATGDAAAPSTSASGGTAGGVSGGASGGASGGVAPPTTAAGPVTLSTGTFEAHAHPTSGTALLVEVDGRTYVRFEGLETDNGPDLLVYLTTESAGAQQIGADHVELGALKGNVGNQNYEVPAGVDLSKFNSVVIWCRRFSVSFGAAPVAVQA